MREIRRSIYTGILLLAALLTACTSTPAQDSAPMPGETIALENTAAVEKPDRVGQASTPPEQEAIIQETPTPEPETPVPVASPTPASEAMSDAGSLENSTATAPLLKPYPYTTPLPPPTPTLLDGIYVRQIPFTGTPVPCRRCAPYRLDGGDWILYLDRGAFRVSHEGTGFQGVGSFTVSDDQLLLFNDPNCHLDVARYRWRLAGTSLTLEPLEDTCGFGLRSTNLAHGSWERQDQGLKADPCQPPSMEAAITGHWPMPPGCN
jgi:hypothetical protein